MLRNIILISLIAVSVSLAWDTSNTIQKSNFNFGHQSGYMYSRMGDAYFKEAGFWDFQTGFMAYYTRKMPLVRNPYWEERLMLTVPLYFIIYPCNAIALEMELTDLFVEFPYQNRHNTGGKTPRFKTKMRLLKRDATDRLSHSLWALPFPVQNPTLSGIIIIIIMRAMDWLELEPEKRITCYYSMSPKR